MLKVLLPPILKHWQVYLFDMEHTKKLILIPESVLMKLERQRDQETKPIVKSLVGLDEKLDNTLTRDDLSDVDKKKIFDVNLERYLSLRDQKNNEMSSVNTPVKPSVPSDETMADLPVSGISSSDDILDSLPKNIRSTASLILKKLKKYPNLVSWDETGKTTISGETIQHSNISDLLRDAIRGRKDYTAAGSSKFFEVLLKR